MMRKAFRNWRLAFVLLAALLFTGTWLPSAAWAETAEQVQEVREVLSQYHLSKPAEEDLNQQTIDEMIESLGDPYTEYFSEEEWESFFNNLEQTFTGIGIRLIEEDGVVYVEDIIPGGPAEAAGMLPGDALTSADGASLKGLSVAGIQEKLLGPEGTSVQVGVTRDGKLLTFSITRKTIQLPTAFSQMMGDGVGYLALTAFTSDAGEAFAEQLDKLAEAGMTSLIFDLRNNGGGYVNAAQEIAEYFMDEGVLAYLKDRDGNKASIDVRGGRMPYPVTVLVNGASASASELLAGALQDYRIAKLVGTRTFGKGLVQSLVPLESGGVLKITVQEYLTPKGRKVNQTGLTPQVEIAGASEQLIGAFREAGGKQVEVGFDKGSILINGVRTAFPNALLQNEGKTYVQLRLIASIVGASIGYDPETGTVDILDGDQYYQLPRGDSRLINKNGWNMIELTSAIRLFPELTSETANGQLKLSARSQ